MENQPPAQTFNNFIRTIYLEQIQQVSSPSHNERSPNEGMQVNNREDYRKKESTAQEKASRQLLKQTKEKEEESYWPNLYLIKSLHLQSNSITSKALKFQGNIKKVEPKQKMKKIKKIQPMNKRKKKQMKVSTDYRRNNKNIPKNYCKAIINYVLRNKSEISHILSAINSNCAYDGFYKSLKRKKKEPLNKIESLRYFWTDAPYAREMRVISEHFVKKRAFHWIYSSSKKISTIIHLKARVKVLNVLKNPLQFFTWDQ